MSVLVSKYVLDFKFLYYIVGYLLSFNCKLFLVEQIIGLFMVHL